MFRSKMLAFIQSFFMISALFILDACGDDSASSPESLNDHPSESEHIETSSSVLEKSSSSNRTKSSSSINSRSSSSSTISSSSSKIAIDPSTVVAGTLTDTRDGQTYRTVKIGELVWMAENLNYKVEDSYCYNDEDGNCDKYGRLYTWNAAVAACPSGWHLPTSYEYRMLIDAVGGERMAVKTLASTKGWQGDANGSDVYTFTMLPGGFSDSGPSYQGEGEVATFWSFGAPSPTEYIEHIRAVEAGYDDLIFTGAVDFFFVADGDVITDLLIEEDGASVRCVEGELMDYIKFSSSSEEESSSSFESSSSGKYELLVDSRDGQTYRIVTIGTQTWMAQNLNYEIEDSYCYDDDPAKCAT